MATTRKLAVKVQKDIEGLGRNLLQVSKKLLGEATDTTLNAAEKALAAGQKRLHALRVQMNKPTQ